MSTPEMLLTARMRLVPATVELRRAEIEEPTVFPVLLATTIPPNWPPELLADALPWFLQQLEASSERVGWMDWYGIMQATDAEGAMLIASGGFMGPPQDGTVEVGYSVLPQFQGKGFATEMVTELVKWAMAHVNVKRVIAEVRTDNTPSLRLLRRVGFAEVGAGSEPGYLRFERTRTATT